MCDCIEVVTIFGSFQKSNSQLRIIFTFNYPSHASKTPLLNYFKYIWQKIEGFEVKKWIVFILIVKEMGAVIAMHSHLGLVKT
jgi:hypothetical protein